MTASTSDDVNLILIILVLVLPIPVTILKGRWRYLVLGVLLTPLILWIPALRLATPDSFWARHFYGWYKKERSTHRFAEDGPPPEVKERLAQRSLVERIFNIDRSN